MGEQWPRKRCLITLFNVFGSQNEAIDKVSQFLKLCSQGEEWTLETRETRKNKKIVKNMSFWCFLMKMYLEMTSPKSEKV